MAHPSTITNDIDAFRAVVDAVQALKRDEQERVLRWAAEKLGVAVPLHEVAAPQRPAAPSGTGAPASDIKSFVGEKSPKSDIQFAATVAYFHRFVAAEGARKDAINKSDLEEACRLVKRALPSNASLTLNNAYSAGVLDRAEAGHFRINTVGENLVSMTLPGGDVSNGGAARRRSSMPQRKSANGSLRRAKRKVKR